MSGTGGKRVLITGVSRFLGLRLAKRFEEDDAVDGVVGVDVEEPSVPIRGLEFVRADIRSPLIARVLGSMEIDTVVHTNISSSPGRLGGRSRMKENNVIGTLQLLGAVQRSEAIQKVVVKSSTAVYGAAPGQPSIIPEDHAGGDSRLTGYGKDCSEAETYARDFGRRRRDVDLVVLRTQNVVGPTVHSSMTDYLSLPVMPTALGFDPRLQLLHEEDAVEALYLATTRDCRGIFNVASRGVVYLSQAIRLLGKVQLPLLPFGSQATARLLRRFGVIDFPIDQLKLLLYGRVVDIRRSADAFAYSPRYTTRATVEDFRDNRNPQRLTEPAGRPTWELELVEHLRRRSARDGATM